MPDSLDTLDDAVAYLMASMANEQLGLDLFRILRPHVSHYLSARLDANANIVRLCCDTCNIDLIPLQGANQDVHDQK